MLNKRILKIYEDNLENQPNMSEDVLEKYMDSGSYILDFFDSNEQHILEEYLSLSKTQA